MPCRSDYLEATGLEKGLKETAQLAVYLGGVAGLPVPKDIIEQAANYYATDVGQVQWLCDTLTKMSSADREHYVYDAHNRTARDLATWWEKHQEADTKRELEEAEARARENALKKLTPADRRALGL